MWCKNVLEIPRHIVFVSKHKQVLRFLPLTQARCSSALSYTHGVGPKSLGQERLRYLRIGDGITEAAHQNPNRVAIKSLHEDLILTYEDLINQSNSLGCALRSYGLERGDRVAICSHNCAGWIVAMVATLRVGLIPVAINPLYEKPELSFCMKKTECKAIIIGEDVGNRSYYKILTETVPEIIHSKPGSINSKEFPSLKTVVAMGKRSLPGTVSYDKLITDFNKSSLNEVDRFAAEVTPEDGSIIHFTSGTTETVWPAKVCITLLKSNNF